MKTTKDRAITIQIFGVRCIGKTTIRQFITEALYNAGMIEAVNDSEFLNESMQSKRLNCLLKSGVTISITEVCTK